MDHADTVKLIVAGTELGGRMNNDALELLDAAAYARAQSEPRALQKQAARAWRARWLTMLGVAAQSTVAASIVSEGWGGFDAKCGPQPSGVDVWLDDVWRSFNNDRRSRSPVPLCVFRKGPCYCSETYLSARFCSRATISFL